MSFKEFVYNQIVDEVYKNTLKKFEDHVRDKIISEFYTLRWSIGSIIHKSPTLSIASINFENENNSNDSGLLITSRNEVFGLIYPTSNRHPFTLSHAAGETKLYSIDEQELNRAIRIVRNSFDKVRTKEHKKIFHNNKIKLKNEFKVAIKKQNTQTMKDFSEARK